MRVVHPYDCPTVIHMKVTLKIIMYIFVCLSSFNLPWTIIINRRISSFSFKHYWTMINKSNAKEVDLGAVHIPHVLVLCVYFIKYCESKMTHPPPMEGFQALSKLKYLHSVTKLNC